MKEIEEILTAYRHATKEGKKTALATVVHVEGSSYRRPGARMLVTEDGHLTGAISGGCLEGDALRKALLAIMQSQNKLVTYDTTDEGDEKFGVQLGCNGIVHILFEPIDEEKETNPLYLLQQLTSKRKDAVLVTVFSLDHLSQPGTSLLYRDDLIENSLPGILKEQIINEAKQVLENNFSSLQVYQYEARQMNAFIEFIPPPVSLIIAGAGNDVQPLVELSSLLGWHTTVVDGRGTHPTAQRFPKANRLMVAKPTEVLSQLETDSQTVYILMTHNYNYDLALLKTLLQKDCRYIGILGPRKKLQRMFDELRVEGIVITDKQRSVIHSPIGLDIGAETSEEIALSIVAEIKAVLSGREGRLLKDKVASIHDSPIKTRTANG